MPQEAGSDFLFTTIINAVLLMSLAAFQLYGFPASLEISGKANG